MSSLILPRRFTSQPQDAVEVDWSNQLTQGLIAGFTGTSLFDATGRDKIVLAGTGAIGATDKGLALIGNNSSATGSLVIDLSPYRGFSYSGWVDFADQASVGADDMLFEYTANINSNIGGFYFDAKPTAGTVDLAIRTSSSYGFSRYTAPTTGRHYVSVVIDLNDAGYTTQKRFYLDGVRQTATSYPFTGYHSGSFPNSTLYLMSRGNASLYYAGKMAGFAIHGRAISDSEAGELAQNNWQIFRAPKRVLYFGGSSGALYPPLLTNTQTFPGATLSTGSVTVSPALLTNAQTFYPSTVSRGAVSVSAPLVSNSQTFPGATVSVGSVTVSPALVTNSQTFYALVVTQEGGPQFVSPALFTNAQVWYAPVVSNGGIVIAPPLLSNGQTFPGATITTGAVSLLPALLTNDQIFFGATVSNVAEPGTGTLDPTTIAAIADAVWQHSLATTLTDRMQIASAILRNKTVTDPVTGTMTVYADDGVTQYLTAQLHENVAQTQTYRGQGAEVRGRLQ